MFKLEKPLRFFLLLFLVFIALRSLAVFTDFPEKRFPEINYLITKNLVFLSSKFPFSVGDLLYTVLSFFFLFLIVKMIQFIRLKNWKNIRKLTSVFMSVLILFLLVFHFFWGFNYYKVPLKKIYNVEEISTEELKLLAEFYLEKSIETREFASEDESGIFKIELNKEDLNREILNSSMKIKKLEELRLKYILVPNLKKSLYSTGFSYMGVLGYYNPFTGEAQYNANMPDTKVLFTEFHETAHQWGFASESEANFVGYLIGVNSDNRSFNYASNYKALRSILNKIVWEDPAYVESILNCYSPKMKKDREYELFIQEKYLHNADDAFSMLNEAYLQLNNQDGLASYGQFVELLVGFHRKYNSLTDL